VRIESARETAYRLADLTLVKRNWLLGRRIAQEELGGAERADYGSQVIKDLSHELTNVYGKGFNKTNLYSFVQFYKAFPEIFHAVSGKSESNPKLSWSHYRTLLQVTDKDARDWYATEAEREGWGVRTLQRNISSQYYNRMLQTYDKEGVHEEMEKLTSPLQDKLEYIKSPVIAEFLGLGQGTDYLESTLETAILSNITAVPNRKVGKGYAFVARQQP